MEALRLFTLESSAPGPARRPRAAVTPESLDAELCHDTELFLADHVEREGDVAHIQVALVLCDAAGSRSRATLEDLQLDGHRFPRSAYAVRRVAELLELPVPERPEGFWPRFLLDQLNDAQDI